MTTALVLGDANCVYADAEAAQALFTPDIVAATNNIGVTWPHVDHWFTLHPLRAANWDGIELALNRRIKNGLNRPKTWAHKPAKGIDIAVGPDWGGSTGLLAVKGLLDLGVDRIVLAGVPLTKETAHFYESNQWTQAPRYQRGWNRHVEDMKPFVRSMSGWTRALLGPPTVEWLTEAG